MANFNLVQKPKKIETEEYEEETEEQTESTSEVDKTNKDNNKVKNKKPMVTFMFFICGCFCLILFILLIFSLFSKKSYTYQEIEEILKDAAVDYFADNKNQLPSSDGDVVEIEAANLVAAGKMKDLYNYTKEGISCTASVQVEKADSEYLYIPYLNCGDNYATTELYKKVVSEDNIVSTGYGLYKINEGYVFKGEEVNNYVKLDKILWRIVKIDSNYNMELIAEDRVGSPVAWDDRYNESVGFSSGMNNYSASRIKEYIDKIYTNPDDDLKELFLSKKDKSRLVAFNVCTGKRSENEVSDRSIECSQALNNQKVGLINIYDYMNASIDSNCKVPASLSCQNYNYLVNGDSFWTVTGTKDNDYEVYRVTENGKISLDSANFYAYVRPVIYLNSKVLVKSGNGSLEKPYKIR